MLDGSGVIVYVNSAWAKFAIENASLDPNAYLVHNYIDARVRASCAGDTFAREAAEGIKAVIAGALPSFGQKYPCHSPELERWFLISATRASVGSDIVIAHSDITQLVQAERANAEAERQLVLAHERFEASRALAQRGAVRKDRRYGHRGHRYRRRRGKIQSINHAAERIFGYRRDEAVGASVSILMDEAHQMFQEAPRRWKNRAGHDPQGRS